MFNYILNCRGFVFKVTFFKQLSGKDYSFNKVLTLVFLTNFSQFFSQFLVNFQSDFVQLLNSTCLNCICFVFKVFFFLNNGKFHSFKKVFKPIFLVNFQSIISQFFSQFFSQICSELVVNFIHLTKSAHQIFQSIFSQLLVDFLVNFLIKYLKSYW